MLIDIGLEADAERRPTTRLARAWAGVRANVAAQAARWPLWTPVAFGGGAAIYLGLKTEPALWLLTVLGLAAVALAVTARRLSSGLAAPLAVLLACLALGALAGKARTERVRAPVVPADLGVTLVEGWVVDVAAPGATGSARAVIAPAWIEGLAPAETPHRIRLTFRDGPVRPGAAIQVRAAISPPPAPASPGAYDFARDAWFRSVGGVGFTLGEPRETQLSTPPWRLRAAMALNAFRWRLAERILARLGPEAGGVAAAMTTGHEAWISPETTQVMRDSGLAHILSISGLHMAIVGGFVFFAVRLMVAAWPWLALRAPGKKIAAVAGLMAVLLYLAISGAPPAAVRAAVTTSVAFLAILADRRAVTLNALAVAAWVVLLIQPEAVAQPGFQMSFAATTALVALVEAWPRRVAEISVPWPILLAQRARTWMFAAIAISLVAGLATGPFAIQHFNRVALYGLLANLLVEPLSTFLIMPALALGALLERTILGQPLLEAAGFGIERMVAVGKWTASLPGAVQLIPSAPQAALPVAFLGLLFLCLWKGNGRWLGLPLAFAVTLWPRPEPPVGWLAADGAAAAVRKADEAVLLRPDSKRFAAELWARRHGLPLAADEAAAAEFDCVRYACRPLGGARPRLAASWAKRPLSSQRVGELCAGAKIVSLRSEAPALPQACAGVLVLDAADFRAGGSAEIYDDAKGRRLVWSRDSRGVRPWTLWSSP